MIDHIGIPASDVARATEFYSKALAALSISIGHGGVSRESGHGAAVGFGASLKPFFWIGEAEGLSGGHVHVAFAAPSRAAVDAFPRSGRCLLPRGDRRGRQGQWPSRLASPLPRQLLLRLRARSQRQYRGRLPPALK
jgi:catechol 2,3-dioxygenase-like lactoylglutathione lyase family enzyme